MDLNFNDTSTIFKPRMLRLHSYFTDDRFPTKAGQINYTLSVPYVNAFYFQPKGELPKSNFGFFGVSAGVEYYYRKNRFLSFSASAVTSFEEPIPVPIDYFGRHETLNSWYVTVNNNKKIKRFSLGYGLNFSKNIWAVSDTTSFFSKKSYSVGVTLNSYYQINKYFFIGLVYRPSIFRIYPSPIFSYEQLFSLDLTFKFPANMK
ncbi:MAG TPA: hypothetical protein DGG95_12610 [Cytophagales bacterium]|nr:hypothetical protein [Cytophagales bacterium]